MTASPILCVLCPPHRAKLVRDGGVTDWDCHARLHDQLVEIAERFALLSAAPGVGAVSGRRAPGFHSRPPLNLHIAALRDPRTAPAELGEPHSAPNLLISWASWVRAARRQAPATYAELTDQGIVVAEAGYLTGSIDWLTRQPWITTLADQARVVLSQLRSATGDPNPRPIGFCTDDPLDRPTCGHPLFAPDSGGIVHCAGCGTSYDAMAQIELRLSEMAAGTPTPTGCSACPHSDAQHDNDAAGDRRCNARWCDCTAYTAKAA